jgi:hypothetical protein
MDVEKKASVIPKHVTYSDFDPLTGGSDASKEDYFQSTFHTSDQVDGDAIFKTKADLLGSSGSELLGEKDEEETATEASEIANTKAQTKEAAL